MTPRGSRWREVARDRIRYAIETAPGNVRNDPKALRKHVSRFYPFGERKYHPYKIWLTELAAAMPMGIVREKDPIRIKCRACGAPRNKPCRPDETFAHALLVAHDAEQEGRLELADQIRLQAFHETRRVDVGINATLPLFSEAP